MVTNVLTPEEQLRNVAQLLREQTAVKRLHNGRRQGATYRANASAIAGTGRQLADMVLAYLDGKLQPKEVGSPF